MEAKEFTEFERAGKLHPEQKTLKVSFRGILLFRYRIPVPHTKEAYEQGLSHTKFLPIIGDYS